MPCRRITQSDLRAARAWQAPVEVDEYEAEVMRTRQAFGNSLDLLARQVVDDRERLHKIKMQATRRHRASDLKRYLVTDLEIIERIVS